MCPHVTRVGLKLLVRPIYSMCTATATINKLLIYSVRLVAI